MAAVVLVTMLVAMVATVTGTSTKTRGEYDEPDWGDCLHSNGAVCNYRGRCVYGECQCRNDYYGPQCQHYKYAVNCLTVKNCVQCIAFGTGPLDTEQCHTQCPMSTEIVDELDEQQFMCVFVDTDHCRFIFTLRYSDEDPGRVDLQVLRDRECPQD